MPDSSSQQDTGSTQQDVRPDLSNQAGWDQAFGQLAQQVPQQVPQQGTFGQEFLQMQSQAYWRLIEDNLRIAREVSQYATLYAVRQQITQEAAQQAIPHVINFLRQHPELVQSMVSSTKTR